MSTSVKFAQLEQAPKAEPELGSVVFKVSASSNPGERIDDNATPDHESTPEETISNSSPHTLLVDDPFSTRNSKILFESIDQLRNIRAGKDLDLPQLVIVGKQSAGKSSLLQSLTDIPFPVGSRLCTRFATLIISKRSAEPDNVRASIEDSEVDHFKYRDEDDGGDDFDRPVPSLTPKAFEELVQQASDHMGINAPHGSENRNFSSKVLKIELSGPTRSPFGILDVPGVFSATTRGVTDEEMKGVTDLVTSYMRKPGNIIILVADASDDLANQSIFKLAGSLDVDSSRLVAVFTKCDRAQVPKNIVQIVKDGDGISGKILRWHVVRNCHPNASSSFDREEEEAALFNSDPWLEIPEDRRGTTQLKSFLGQLLCKRIREGFPQLQIAVRVKLQAEQVLLERLGEPRENHDQRSFYLRNIVSTYEDLARKALRSPAELPRDDIKLRGFTQNMNADFAKMMIKKGHKYKFLEIGQELEADWSQDDSDSDYDDSTLSVPISSLSRIRTPNGRPLTPESSATSGRRQQSTRQSPPQSTMNPLYQEIQKQIKANRGEELPGMLNPAVLKSLWVTQTSKWMALAQKHLEKLVELSTSVAVKIFREATSSIDVSESTMHKLQDTISDFGRKEKEKVLDQLRELCLKNASQALQTNNPQFDSTINEARRLRFKGALERYRAANPPVQFLNRVFQGTIPPECLIAGPEVYERWMIVDDDFVKKLFNEIHPYGEREQNTQDEIHDLLKAYYDIALQNFLHDIETSIVEPFLNSKSGPLLGLSTDYILRLSEAEVEDLGGEDQAAVDQRRDAMVNVERLRRAQEIAASALRRTREVERVGV